MWALANFLAAARLEEKHITGTAGRHAAADHHLIGSDNRFCTAKHNCNNTKQAAIRVSSVAEDFRTLTLV